MKMRYHREEFELEIGDILYDVYNIDVTADVYGYGSHNPWDYDAEITDIDFCAFYNDENDNEIEVEGEELKKVEDYLTEWIYSNAEWEYD